MKIFGVIHSSRGDSPIVYYKGEGTLREGYPLFLPDIEESLIVAIPALFIKIGRTGKFVDPSFAHRYIESIGVGYDVTAMDCWVRLRRQGLPWDRAKDFDGAAVIGNAVPFEPQPSYTIEDLEHRAIATFPDLDLYRSLSEVSKNRIIHTGDIIFLIDSSFYDLPLQGFYYSLQVNESYSIGLSEHSSLSCVLRTK